MTTTASDHEKFRAQVSELGGSDPAKALYALLGYVDTLFAELEAARASLAKANDDIHRLCDVSRETASALARELEVERAKPKDHIDDCGVVQSPGGTCTCVEDARELSRKLQRAERVVDWLLEYQGIVAVYDSGERSKSCAVCSVVSGLHKDDCPLVENGFITKDGARAGREEKAGG